VLQGYTDIDYTGDVDSRKSTFGYMMTYAGGAVSLQSRLQTSVLLSTIDVEYIALVDAFKEVLWMKNFLQEWDMKQEKYTLFCDSQSAIHLAKNPSIHSQSKHIVVRYHWIRDVVSSKLMHLEKIHTDKNCSDMMAKILLKDKMLDEGLTLQMS
jgi:ATP-binding cassette subfamily B (MDR/TAP) protein 1